MHFIIGFAILFLLLAFFPRLFLTVLAIGVGSAILAIIGIFLISNGLPTIWTHAVSTPGMIICSIIFALIIAGIDHPRKERKKVINKPSSPPEQLRLELKTLERIEPHF